MVDGYSSIGPSRKSFEDSSGFEALKCKEINRESKVKEENEEQQRGNEHPPDVKQATKVNGESVAQVAASPKSTVRDTTTADANSGQQAAPQYSQVSIAIGSKNSLAKKRKKAAHRRRLRASPANG